MRLIDTIHQLSRQGRHYFLLEEIITLSAKSKSAVIAALARLQKKGIIACPHQGFYLIIPPHLEIYGCLPAEQFIPDLLTYLGINYYVGILSAAQYYGSSHQKPQQYQVVIEKHMRPVKCGRIYSVFVKNKCLDNVPTQLFNTSTGYVKVSSSEATAIDLIRYLKHSGGLNNVATILIELTRSIDAKKLELLLPKYKIETVHLQRLGFLFELIGKNKLANGIDKYLKSYILQTRPLLAGVSTKNAIRNRKWELYLNVKVEPDL